MVNRSPRISILIPSLGVQAILRNPLHHSLCIDTPNRTRMTAKSIKVERYARIRIPIAKDVYEVVEPAIVAVSKDRSPLLNLGSPDRCNGSCIEDQRPAFLWAFQWFHYCVTKSDIISWLGALAITGMRGM